MDMKQIVCLGALGLFATCSQATVVTYDNLPDLFVNPGLKTTYDFETLTGFPSSGGTFAHIGMFNGVNFDASAFSYSGAISGTQAMTGSSDSFSAANVDFSGVSGNVVGVGLWGLDLLAGSNEAIVLNVNYSDSSTQSYNITLNGDASFTPEYFGLYSNDTSQLITSISLYGTDDTGAQRAWLIDDLTVITAGSVPSVPVPAAAWLFGSGLVGLVGVARRKRKA
jgi:hypothetical protein